MENRTEFIPETGDLRAAEIDLAIEGHEHLYGLDLRVMLLQVSAIVDKLVGKVLNGVPELLQGVPRFGTDPTRSALAQHRNGNGPR